MSIASREFFPGEAAFRRQLKRLLTPRRFAHALASAAWAASLAEGVGVNPQRAYCAGLLHDCARDLSDQELHNLLRGYRGPYRVDFRRTPPALWHNAAGLILARRCFDIRDTGILRAMALHSTGAPRMRTLDKIIYVADFSEPLRRHPECRRVHRLARNHLDAAVAAVARAKLAYVRQHGLVPHPRMLALARTFRKK